MTSAAGTIQARQRIRVRSAYLLVIVCLLVVSTGCNSKSGTRITFSVQSSTSSVSGPLRVEVRGGSKVEFEAPFYGDAVLFLLAQRQSRNVGDIAHIGHRSSLPTEELVLLSEQIRLHHGT